MEDFRAGLGIAIQNRIGPLALAAFRDVFINSKEFGLGFYVPVSQFPPGAADNDKPVPCRADN